MLFILSEKTVKELSDFSTIDERLKKRREQYEFDKYLQNWISKINIEKYIKTHIIPCGNKSFYKSEMIINDRVYFHFNHSFNHNSKYNEKYLKMNLDADSPKFAYFLYNFNKEKNEVTSLKVVVPSVAKNSEENALDLTETLKLFRQKVIEKNYDLKYLISNIPLLNSTR